MFQCNPPHFNNLEIAQPPESTTSAPDSYQSAFGDDDGLQTASCGSGGEEAGVGENEVVGFTTSRSSK